MSAFSTAISGLLSLQAKFHAFTDTSGTTPATALDDLVAALKVSGVNAVQATSGKRPKLKLTGGPPLAAGGSDYYMRFDGSDDVLADASVTVGNGTGDYSFFLVCRPLRRASTSQAMGQIGSAGTVYTYINDNSKLGQWDGTGHRFCEFGYPDYWCFLGVTNSNGTLHFYRDDFDSASVSSTALSTGSGLTIGAAPSSLFAEMDIALALFDPMAALSAGNVTTLRAEVAAYYAGLPFAIPAGVTLIVSDGHSLGSAGSNASDVVHEYQHVGVAALTGLFAEVHSLGQPGDAMTNIEARQTYVNGYPASVGRTKAQSVFMCMAGYNDTDSSGFITYMEQQAALWGMAIMVSPAWTLDWSGTGGDDGVTAFYAAVMAHSFPANVIKVDMRSGGLSSYASGDYTDGTHFSDTGSAKAGALLAVALQAAVAAVAYPVITVQPSDADLTQGDTVHLSVTATGATLTYQWYKDGVAMAGQATSALSISPVAPSDAADYTCLVTQGGVSSLLSDAATITVAAAPVGTIAPHMLHRPPHHHGGHR